MNKQRVKFLLTVICMLAAGICYSCSGRTNQEEPDSLVMTTVPQTEEETSGERDAQTGLISAETESVYFYVHICGEVKNPGVYALKPGSRMFQAVELAGGLTGEAAGDYLNMALEIADGMKVTVPSRADVEKEKQQAQSVPGDRNVSKDENDPEDAGAAGRGSGREGMDSGQWIEMPGDDARRTDGQSGWQADAPGGAASREKVNLNTAAKEELMTLRGIGEARAADIIHYREEKGPFQAIEEIMNVSGIKEAAFQKIKDDITVQDKAP